jgi:hypothetical protein
MTQGGYEGRLTTFWKEYLLMVLFSAIMGAVGAVAAGLSTGAVQPGYSLEFRDPRGR